jgi:hypothetical protein
MPIADVVQKGLDNINKVVDKFSPLSQAQRAAEVAKYTLISHAFQAGQSGDWKTFQDIMQHISGKQDPFTQGYMMQSGKNYSDLQYKGGKPLSASEQARADAQAAANARAAARIRDAKGQQEQPKGLPLVVPPDVSNNPNNPNITGQV